MVEIKQKIISIVKDVGKLEPSYIFGGRGCKIVKILRKRV